MKWLLRSIFFLLLIALFLLIFDFNVDRGGVHIKLKGWITEKLSKETSIIEKKVRHKTKKVKKQIKKKVEQTGKKMEDIPAEEKKKLEKILEKH